MDISNGLYRPDIFDVLFSDFDQFHQIISGELINTYQNWGFRVEISDSRLRDAYVFWVSDLNRVKYHELPDSSALDHYKQSAHLIYWLRRTSPVIHAFIAELDPTETEQLWQAFMYEYGQQYAAFKIGFDLCRYFEGNRIGSPYYVNDYVLELEYCQIVGHVLKAKNVSPHAVFLVLKSLFTDPLANIRP